MNEDVIMIVSSWENMQDNLNRLPHRMCSDLTLCYFSMRQGKSGNMVELRSIDNDEASQRGFANEEELYQKASVNTQIKFPLFISNWNDDISVVTNEKNIFGATSIFYPGCLEGVSRKTGGDLLVIPSSIHEVLCLPFDLADPNELKMMLYQANNEVVPEEDVLSYNIYRYDSKEQKLDAYIADN